MNFAELLSNFSSPGKGSLENTNPNRVRYNVYDPEGQKALILFEKAVALMKDRSEKKPGDPLGWAYQAGIHGIWNLSYSNPIQQDRISREDLAKFAEEFGFDTKQNVLDGNTVLDNCTHFTPLWNGLRGGSAMVNTVDSSPANFIAWHRLYLQYFEEIVRENLRLSGEEDAESWALPYWAYLNEGEFVMPELLRQSDSSLYTPFRNPQLNAGIPLTELTNLPDWLQTKPKNWPEETLRGLYQNTYLAMGTLIENMPHNGFHVASGWNGGLFPDGGGLMLPVSSAAFDPVFWIHHSFIDKLWSAYNASGNAFYGFEYFFDQNPWNYMFLAPSSNGELKKETISFWGNNSANVVSKIYNPDYSYDYFGTSTNPENIPGPNKVLSIIQAPAFRPIISNITWNKKSEKIAEDRYISVIPISVDTVPVTAGNYRNLTSRGAKNHNPFEFVSQVDFLLPENKYARFVLTTESVVNNPDAHRQILSFDQPGQEWGLFVQGLPMGMKDMAMQMTSTIDFGYTLDATNRFGYSYVPSVIKPDDPIVLVMLSDSETASVTSVVTSLNQNLNINGSTDSTFDAAAYFAQFPELLRNDEATADTQAYYEKHDRSRGIVAPEINFRAAATGIAYLMENNSLLHSGISASPYAAISHYLSFGQKQGLSLGDSSLIAARSYLRSNNQFDGTILDFTKLQTGQELSANIIIGGDAAYKPIVGFYRVADDAGSIIVDGVAYNPGHADYARLATSSENLFDSLTGLNANNGLAEHRHGVTFTRDSGMLAPFAIVNEHTYFGFAKANPDKRSHFRSHGTNILGLEDMLYDSDTDFDDTLIGFKFMSETSPLGKRNSTLTDMMPQPHQMNS